MSVCVNALRRLLVVQISAKAKAEIVTKAAKKVKITYDANPGGVRIDEWIRSQTHRRPMIEMVKKYVKRSVDACAIRVTFSLNF